MSLSLNVPVNLLKRPTAVSSLKTQFQGDKLINNMLNMLNAINQFFRFRKNDNRGMFNYHNLKLLIFLLSIIIVLFLRGGFLISKHFN